MDPSQPAEALARADAFGTLGLARRAALWAVKGLPLGAAGGAPPLPPVLPNFNLKYNVNIIRVESRALAICVTRTPTFNLIGGHSSLGGIIIIKLLSFKFK